MSELPLTDEEIKQQMHYDEIMQEYELHYDDKYSQKYRKIFINKPLLSGIDLKGKKVLEAMCGSGQTTAALLNKGAQVTGLDISKQAVNSYQKKWPGIKTVQSSIFQTPFEDNSFDAVTVVGGLHHLHPDMKKGIDEIHRILKVGGWFCFMEPHKGSIQNWFRQRWYGKDKLFEENEEAVDITQIEKEHHNKFRVISKEFHGGPAYLFVLNSMVWRIPHKIKKYYSSPLLFIEKLIDPLINRYLAGHTVCQWRKK